MEEFFEAKPSVATVKQYVSTIHETTLNSTSTFYLFFHLCTYNYLSIAQEFYTRHQSKIDITEEDNIIFRFTCESGHLKIAQWLYKVEPGIDIHAKNDFAFRFACTLGHLELAKWLIVVDPQLDFTAKDEYALTESLVYGHLLTGQWVYSLRAEPQRLLVHNMYILKFGCEEGSLDVVKWICEILESAHIVFDTSVLLIHAATSGQVDICAWLLDKFTEIDVHADNNVAFTQSCMECHLTTAKLIASKSESKEKFAVDAKFLVTFLSNGNFNPESSTQLLEWLLTFTTESDVQDYLTEHDPEYTYLSILSNLARHGCQTIMKWCFNKPSIFPIHIFKSNFKSIFKDACGGNQLKMAQWLLSMNPTFKVDTDNNVIFNVMCYFGHLDIAKWLYSLKPTMTITGYSLITACAQNDNIDVLKWLLEVRPLLDISYENHRTFRQSCKNNFVQVAEFLTTLNSNYVLETNASHTEIVDYAILNFELTFKNKIATSQSWDAASCMICQLPHPTVQTNCLHRYCETCMTTLFLRDETSCPYCTQKIQYLTLVLPPNGDSQI